MESALSVASQFLGKSASLTTKYHGRKDEMTGNPTVRQFIIGAISEKEVGRTFLLTTDSSRCSSRKPRREG